MLTRKILIVACLALCGAARAQTSGQTSDAAVRDLIARWLPKHTTKFVVETIPATMVVVEKPANTGTPRVAARPTPGQAKTAPAPVEPSEFPRDVFELASQDGKVVLRGNNPVAVASALNYYLKYVANCQVAWDGMDQVNLPAQLPMVSPKIRAVSPHVMRYAYQPATHSYTTPYWNWEKWQREIDFLAMSGINRALVVAGQEAVWQATWKSFGYSDDEIRKWLVMPAHAPWQMTGNLESYGGPVPQSLIDARLRLGQQIVKRMRELGIEPVLPGYFGIVPPDFKKKRPAANVVPQGNWMGDLKRPDVLDPSDPILSEIADKYYAAQKQYFGDAHYFSADPFNDKGKPGELNLVDGGKAIYAAMDKASPGATWVLMATVDQPIGSLIFSVPKDHVLILDLAAERKEWWKDRKAFDGATWLWCAMNNEGGRSGLDGDLAYIANAATRAAFNPERGNMSGIGVTAHSGLTNAPYWDLMLENSWRDQDTNATQWLLRYPKRRYGQVAQGAERAWGLLRAACYDKNSPTMPEVVTARPYLVPPQTKPNDESHQRADLTVNLAVAWRALLDSASQLDRSSGSEPYLHDVAEVGAQALDALAGRYHVEICKAYRLRDKEALRAAGDKLLGAMRDMDDLLATRREFLTGAWIEDARKWGNTPDEKNLLEQDARTILTTWSVPPTRRYAHRHWSGLVAGYYLPRWEAWIRALGDALDKNAKLNDKALFEQIAAGEIAWAKQTGKLSPYPIGDTVPVAKRVYDKYAADFAAPPLMSVRTINGAWTPKDTATDKMVWLWDVSEMVKEPKDYEAEFKFEKGESGVQIYRVSLWQGNRELIADAHTGYAGASPRDAIYKLKAGAVAPNQPVLLRAEVSGDVSGDSSGTIELRRAKRLDPRLQKEEPKKEE